MEALELSYTATKTRLAGYYRILTCHARLHQRRRYIAPRACAAAIAAYIFDVYRAHVSRLAHTELRVQVHVHKDAVAIVWLGESDCTSVMCTERRTKHTCSAARRSNRTKADIVPASRRNDPHEPSSYACSSSKWILLARALSRTRPKDSTKKSLGDVHYELCAAVYTAFDTYVYGRTQYIIQTNTKQRTNKNCTSPLLVQRSVPARIIWVMSLLLVAVRDMGEAGRHEQSSDSTRVARAAKTSQCTRVCTACVWLELRYALGITKSSSNALYRQFDVRVEKSITTRKIIVAVYSTRGVESRSESLCGCDTPIYAQVIRGLLERSRLRKSRRSASTLSMSITLRGKKRKAKPGWKLSGRSMTQIDPPNIDFIARAMKIRCFYEFQMTRDVRLVSAERLRGNNQSRLRINGSSFV
ncbi:unnamed protein product [Trichogramma brassicae]|uniref:Uncharacterized protein n=1 Tax=Trichogramma brassicae TaxID=86971 RepID=A0A6H5I3D5_9HYME|nr:unnamed protein product [Trichogramma brassicae]